MPKTLSTLKPGQKRKKRKRIGRGNAAGKGTYAGRGLKGQRSRSGGRRGLKRRGLKQYLLQIPKSRGFKRSTNVVGVGLGTYSTNFSEGEHVTPKQLIKKGIVKKGKQVKVLDSGKLTKKLSITAHAASANAIKAIEKAGGTIHINPRA